MITTVAFVCYWVTFRWVDKEGSGAPHTLRITHAWLRSGKDWRIMEALDLGLCKVIFGAPVYCVLISDNWGCFHHQHICRR
jgi:hypothetical protein